jgi:flagellar assembly protein FliH
MRTWKPPSFDAPLPPLADLLGYPDEAPLAVNEEPAKSSKLAEGELQALRARSHQEGFVRGLQEGLQEGRAQGEALGREEGLKLGIAEGRGQGFEQGLAEARESLAGLSKALESVLSMLDDLPRQLEPALIEWVYQTAVRLSGQPAMAREPFVQAVQEALMRLPHPGETLFLRISQSDLALWQQLPDQLPAGMAVTVLDDPHLAQGHAYLEVAGTRVDIGAAARDALVRSALGLLPVSS